MVQQDQHLSLRMLAVMEVMLNKQRMGPRMEQEGIPLEEEQLHVDSIPMDAKVAGTFYHINHLFQTIKPFPKPSTLLQGFLAIFIQLRYFNLSTQIFVLA